METFAPKGQLRGMIMPNYVDRSRTLCIEARYLYAVLCDYAREKDHCWASQKKLAMRIGCSLGSLKKYLRQLEAEKLIWIAHTYKGCKYYFLKPENMTRAVSNFDGSLSNFENSPSKFDGQGSNFDTNPNLKNKKKEYTPPLPPAITPAIAPVARDVSSLSEAKIISQDRVAAEKAFGEVWSAYPRPPRFVSRDKAWREWWKLWRQGALPDLKSVLCAIGLNAKHNPAWSLGNENGRYIPNLENWLAGKRWKDDIPCPSQPLSAPSAHSLHMIQQAQSVLRSLQNLKSSSTSTSSLDNADFEQLAAQFGGIDENKRPMALGLFRLVKAKGLQIQSQAGDFMTVLKNTVAGVS